MPFKKGMQKVPGSGKVAGTPTPQIHRFRVAVAKLLESNENNFMRWLTEIAEGNEAKGLKPDPKGAMDVIAKMAEYAAPKLARTEVVGEGGGPVGLTLMVSKEDQNL